MGRKRHPSFTLGEPRQAQPPSWRHTPPQGASGLILQLAQALLTCVQTLQPCSQLCDTRHCTAFSTDLTSGGSHTAHLLHICGQVCACKVDLLRWQQALQAQRGGSRRAGQGVPLPSPALPQTAAATPSALRAAPCGSRGVQ